MTLNARNPKFLIELEDPLVSEPIKMTTLMSLLPSPP